MKLTIDARLIRGSGIGVYIQNLLKSPFLPAFEVELLVRNEDVDFTKKICDWAILKIFEAKIYSIEELVFSPFKTINADIFWSPHYNVPVFNFASTLKIATIHDVFHLAYSNTLGASQKLYANLMLKRAIRTSDIIFTVSHFSKSEISKYINCSPDKIKVVYNGVDAERFAKAFSAQQEKSIVEKYNLPAAYVLFVGNVKPHKNLKGALLGFKYYCQSLFSSNLTFVIVGKKDGFITGDEEVKKMIEEPFFKEKVLFTGWVDDEDLPLIYQKASLFIFPSVYEGFGFPPLEAMAAGCPVVSSNAACMREIYGDAALYFYPLDEKAIGETIFEVLHNKQTKDELVRKGFEKVKEYSWVKAIELKIGIIKEYLSAPGK